MRKKKKILIVDDEQDLTMLMEHIFLSTGLYDVIVANGGKEGKEKALSEKPDLVFLDYIMPEVRGDDVLKFINSEPRLKDTAVVVMSGLGKTAYFGNQNGYGEEDQEDIVPDVDSLLGESSSLAFPLELIKECGVIAAIPKPFSREKLLKLTAHIFSVLKK
jgi:twitching motility two-component system response regulator PilH